jgi:type VI secretion system protein ImpA
MISAEELLKKISDEKPCGEDLSYDPKFQELETLLPGKPESVMGEVTIAAEEPDWKDVRDRCLELWPRSKDLRLAVGLALAGLKTEGLPAFRDGLALLKGVLEQYWEHVYPLLDADDNNDPTQRVNVIAALATPVGTFGDPLRLLTRLREAPLANSLQMGRFSMADILRSETGQPGSDGAAPAAAAQIEAAFRDTKPEHLDAINSALNDSITLSTGIDEYLTNTIGSGKAPELTLLPKELKDIQKRLIPYLPSGSVTAEAVATDGTPTAKVPGQAITGEIQTRQDVIRMLEKICDYYKREEPSSPVPNIIRRAQRLAEMDFMQIIEELSPDAVSSIRLITGEKPKE